jgi:hypothetical protein
MVSASAQMARHLHVQIEFYQYVVVIPTLNYAWTVLLFVSAVKLERHLEAEQKSVK